MNSFENRIEKMYRVSQKRTFRQPLLPTFQFLEYQWREGSFPPMAIDTVVKLECWQKWLSESAFFWDTL